MTIDLVVTRHSALVEYLRELNLIDENSIIVEHATADDVAGKHVCGVLPHSLSCLTSYFTEVPMRIPAEKRGQELTLEDMHEFAGEPVTYQVNKV